MSLSASVAAHINVQGNSLFIVLMKREGFVMEMYVCMYVLFVLKAY
jgi:hypothetical protein